MKAEHRQPQPQNSRISTTVTVVKIWDNRTRFVVGGMAFLFFVSWSMTMGRLIGNRFWDAERNIREVNDKMSDLEKAFAEHQNSYYTTRFGFLVPHVCCSILWWNLYFFQLIPSIRRKHKRLHRLLGRLLILCILANAVSGVGLAILGHSPTIKLLSIILSWATIYCVYYTWYYASLAKDYERHRYWAMRLVGYMQIIALQRLWMPLLLVCYRFGIPHYSTSSYTLYLYPPYRENDVETVKQIFDDSFVCSFLSGLYLTEWYLAGYYRWTEPSLPTNKKYKSQ